MTGDYYKFEIALDVQARCTGYQVMKKERDQMMTSQERVLNKINKVIERLSQELFMSEFPNSTK